MQADENHSDTGYRRLWRDWIRPFRGQILLSFVFMVVAALASAGYSKSIQLILNAYETSDNTVIYWGPIAIVMIAVIKGFSAYIHTVASNSALIKFAAKLQKAMYKSLVKADMSRLQQETPAELSSRFMTDTTLLQQSVQSILAGISAVLIIVATIGVMLTIDWKITLILIAIFLLSVAPVNAVGSKIRGITKHTQAQMSGMNSEIIEGLTNIRMVRTYQLESHLNKTAKSVFDTLRFLRIKDIKWRSRLSPIMEIISGSAVAALMVVVSWRIAAGTTTVADFMGLLTGVAVVSQPARNLGDTFALIMQGRAVMERIFPILDAKNEIADKPNAKVLESVTGHVQFKQVEFAYPNGFKALKDFTLDVAAGSRVALVGSSGAGKSTVFNLLPRLFDATGGQVLVDGQDVKDVTVASLRKQIAVVSQESVFLSGTVKQNIGFGRIGASDADIASAATAAALHGFIDALAEGCDTKVTSGANQFSGGEKQRLSIARAILRDAPILLLDEPTSALDAESEAAIKAALDRLAKGRTTFIIAHRLSTILDADMIVVMDKGRIVETGTHSELLDNNGLYAELYRLQFTHF
ncbi:MAG: ABC transporter ATP-binding protein [Paracoccaceae bacterium]